MIFTSSCSYLCPIHWSQVLSREWRCSWSSAVRRCSNCIWVINNFIAYSGVTYIRGLMGSHFPTHIHYWFVEQCAFPVQLLSDVPKTHWWLVNNVRRQQAIIWATVDTSLFYHMASLGHNESKIFSFILWWLSLDTYVYRTCNLRAKWYIHCLHEKNKQRHIYFKLLCLCLIKKWTLSYRFTYKNINITLLRFEILNNTFMVCNIEFFISTVNLLRPSDPYMHQ